MTNNPFLSVVENKSRVAKLLLEGGSSTLIQPFVVWTISLSVVIPATDKRWKQSEIGVIRPFL